MTDLCFQNAENSKILGVIPARYDSSRLPGKPLLDICGRTMIEHVYTRADASGIFSNLTVATDDLRVFNAVRDFGGNVMMTSPSHNDGSSRAAEAARAFDCDYVVNIQGDEPLIDPRMLKELMCGFIKDKGSDSATLCRKLTDTSSLLNPNVVKVVRANNGRALYFSRSPIPYKRNETDCPIWEHVGIYAFTKEFLLKMVTLPQTPLMEAESLEQLRILEHGFTMTVIPTSYPPLGPNVNTQEDIEKVREIMAAMSQAPQTKTKKDAKTT